MDELLLRLKKVELVVTFEMPISLLIFPTLKSFKMIIKICEDNASEYKGDFNGNKSKCNSFSKVRECVKSVSMYISVNDNTVEYETEADHLGHRVSSQDSDSYVAYK